MQQIRRLIIDYPYRYSVKAKLADDWTLVSDLKRIRMQVNIGDFNCSGCERAIIQKAHQFLVGASSPLCEERLQMQRQKIHFQVWIQNTDVPSKMS